MLNSIGDVTRARVRAVDGDIGPVEDVLFDDHRWVIRYLVVDAGTWLAEREVLISPYSLKQSVGRGGLIEVALTRRLIRTSPALDASQPVSREYEQEFQRHYHYPSYREGGGLWALGAMPYPSVAPLPRDAAEGAGTTHPAATQLRSAEQMHGYEVVTPEGCIGQVHDLVFDDQTWQIRYFVVDTDKPAGGRKLRVGPPWALRIDWAAQRVHLALTPEHGEGGAAYAGAERQDCCA